jgi:hypothetical protein
MHFVFFFCFNNWGSRNFDIFGWSSSFFIGFSSFSQSSLELVAGTTFLFCHSFRLLVFFSGTILFLVFCFVLDFHLYILLFFTPFYIFW